MLSESMPQFAARGRVRVIGKIQPPGNQAWISVNRSDGDYASVAFTDQSACRKESYKLDWCYDQDEGIQEIQKREIKPLIGEVISGSNACVIAYGARGSGKTRLIQGSEESPGLAPVAVSEILLLAEEIGASVSISSYELIQDHVYDALKPKDQEVLVLEDAEGKIRLKGLYKAPINSASDFNKLFFQKPNLQKPQFKVTDEIACRSHRGLIVYVARVNDGSSIPLVGKMAFIDLAGYEDPKQKGNGRSLLAESTKINMSLYTLLNVIYAQNSNEARIPYRESKLTRLLQEFICPTSKAVLFTCLKPTICQDTIHTLSLASRSCQLVNQHRRDSIRKPTNGLRFIPSCSPCNSGAKSAGSSMKRVPHIHSVERKRNATPSTTKRSFLPLSTSVKKTGKSKIGLVGLKENATPTMTTAKKLFGAPAATPNTNTVNISIREKLALPTEKEPQVLEKNTVQQNCSLINADGLDSFTSEMDTNPVTEKTQAEANNSSPSCDADIDCSVDKENMDHAVSDRLREVLNFLSPQPLRKKSPTSTKVSSTDKIHENHEDCNHHEDPKTPGVPFSIRSYDNQIYAFTPKDSLKTRSTGLKKSLAKECLSFLNSASKEELKALKGIGEKRATYILELREESAEPFKDIEDINMHLGLTSKQINGMISKIFEDSNIG